MEISIGFWGILVIVLVVLKGMGKINLKWKWIFLPIWFPFALGFIALVLYVLGMLALGGII